MSWIDAWRERLRPVFGRGRLTDELDEELAYHFEREVEAQTAKGLDPREARRVAHARMGGAVRPSLRIRSLWSGFELGGLLQELRLATRRLRRQSGFSAIAIVTLGLGIGASTAVFSLVRSILIRPLPYPDADRLAVIWSHDRSVETHMSDRELLEYRLAARTFDGIAAYTDFEASLTEDAEPERVPAAAVTANALELLGARPTLGRVFRAEEDAPGADAVVLLSDELWQRRYGGDPAVVGRPMTVNGRRRTIVGVLPPRFRLPLDYRLDRPTELMVPLAIDESGSLPWGSRYLSLFARLRPGVTPEAASADLRGVARSWVEQGHIAAFESRYERDAVPIGTFLAADVRTPLLILLGAVGFMLLIACANVAHLLLARADARRSEVAVAAAMGAGRLRLARQFLTEAGLLAGAGAVAGLAIAWVGVRVSVLAAPVALFRLRGVGLDSGVLLFAGSLAVAATLIAGLAPAVDLSRVNLAGAIGGVRGADHGRGRRRVRRALVAAEAGLALVLAIGAVLLARSLGELRAIDVGIDGEGTIAFSLTLPAASYPDAAGVEDFVLELTDRIASLDGVASVGAARLLPLESDIGTYTITVEGREPAPGEDVAGAWQVATAGYIETLGIEMAEGRPLAATDVRGAPLVALVSRAMGGRYWPGESALGKRIHLGTADQPWATVVGVFVAPHHNDILEEPRAEMIFPHAQWNEAGAGPRRDMSWVVRAVDPDPTVLVPTIRQQVRAMDASLPVADVRRVDEILANALAEPRFTAKLLGGLALLSVLLAGIGLYGVTSYATRRRTNEMGIRLALGARGGDVARLVLRDALISVAVGVAIGGAAAMWLTRFLAGQLYGVSRLDPVTFVAVPAVLLLVGALAAFLPARRAAAVSPVSALRAE